MRAGEAADWLLTQSASSPLRLLLAGPCGVGKSRVARELESRGVKRIDHDALKFEPGSFQHPCRKSSFDPGRCFGPHVPPEEAFVIDAGGDSIFNRNAANDERLRRMLEFKAEHRLSIAVLVAPREVVEERFWSTRSSAIDDFDELWRAWREVEKPHWDRCADHELDAS